MRRRKRRNPLLELLRRILLRNSGGESEAPEEKKFLRRPPDPINHVYSLPGKYMSQKYFTYPSVQIFKILFRGFILQNPTKI